MEEVVAVLFDFDGVLADSVQVHREAWRATYRHLLEKEMPDFDQGELRGKSSLEIARYIAEFEGRPELAEDLASHKLDLLLSGSVAPPMFPGVKQMFDRLDRYGVPYAIASNAPHDFLDNTLNVWGISVKTVVGFNDVVHPKPAPDLFLTCAEKLGISPSDYAKVHVYEDSAPGIVAAKNAGMLPIGVCTHHSEEELRLVGAERVCHSIYDLITWLDARQW